MKRSANLAAELGSALESKLDRAGKWPSILSLLLVWGMASPTEHFNLRHLVSEMRTKRMLAGVLYNDLFRMADVDTFCLQDDAPTAVSNTGPSNTTQAAPVAALGSATIPSTGASRNGNPTTTTSGPTVGTSGPTAATSTATGGSAAASGMAPTSGTSQTPQGTGSTTVSAPGTTARSAGSANAVSSGPAAGMSLSLQRRLEVHVSSIYHNSQKTFATLTGQGLLGTCVMSHLLGKRIGAPH